MNSFSFPEGFPSSTGGIDWKFIASIYPADLLLNHDKYTMKTIIEDFIKTQSFDGIPSNLAANFLYILQIIMKKLLENSKKTQKKLDNQIRINAALKKKSKGDYDYSDDEVVKDIMDNTTINKSKINSFLCPVCMNCYTSLKYLDMHFFTHHYELADIWQILRTPHYNGFTIDPTVKLLATSTEKSQLRQTIQFLGEEAILDQKENEMKIKNYFRKKFLKVNNKLDQISSNMINDPIYNSNKPNSYLKGKDFNDEFSSETTSNEYNTQKSDYMSEKFEYASNSSNYSNSKYDNDDEVAINTNYQNNNNVNNNNNISMTNNNFATSTNIFVISDSNMTENEHEIKNKSSPSTANYKISPTSPNSFQFSSNNMNSFSNNRIESNMISIDNQTFTNSKNLKTISDDSNELNKPVKVSKIRSRRKERTKAVLETDSSYNDS